MNHWPDRTNKRENDQKPVNNVTAGKSPVCMDLRKNTIVKYQRQEAQGKYTMASFSPTNLLLPLREGEGPINNVQTGQHPTAKS